MTLPLPAAAVIDPRIGAHGPALLALEDGRVFRGLSFGAPLASGGDLVVNTSQSGYQEVCTDPSYAGQVVVMTYPLIGSYGRVADDDQSERPWLHGLVVGHATAAAVEEGRQIVHLLRDRGIPAIAGVDTRALARHLRETGGLRAFITRPHEVDEGQAVEAARGVPCWEDRDFVGRVSVREPYVSEPYPSERYPSQRYASEPVRGECRGDGDDVRGDVPIVAVVDYGLKTNIVRALRKRGARVRVLPHTADSALALRGDVDGIVLSPGPGDPARLRLPVELARSAIRDARPLLGICLGHQIVARAAGAGTRRLRFGHHAANHPVRDVDTGRVQVTAQNHEVEVIGQSVPDRSGFYVSQRNLNDGSVEGLRHRDLPIETVQYHPEGSPGPLDALETFDRFMARVRERHAVRVG